MTSLEKANVMMTELTEKVPEISPISPDDYPLFNQFFNTSPETYGNAWTYVIQGMYGIGKFGIGYKYYDGKNLVAICFYPKLHHEDVIPFYIVRPMGESYINIIKKLSSEVSKLFQARVYVKKIFKDDYKSLVQSGFQDVSVSPWQDDVPAEDDTYPERIIDIEKTLSISSTLGRTRQLNRSLRNYLKTKSEGKYRFESIFEHNSDAKALVDKFFKQRDYLISRPEDYHNIIDYHVERDIYTECLIYLDNEPVGMYIVEHQSPQLASLYATITDREKDNYLTDFIMFDLMFKLKEKGVRLLNLGGSEFKSLDDFKLKFKPSKERQMFWATYSA